MEFAWKTVVYVTILCVLLAMLLMMLYSGHRTPFKDRGDVVYLIAFVLIIENIVIVMIKPLNQKPLVRRVLLLTRSGFAVALLILGIKSDNAKIGEYNLMWTIVLCYTIYSLCTIMVCLRYLSGKLEVEDTTLTEPLMVEAEMEDVVSDRNQLIVHRVGEPNGDEVAEFTIDTIEDTTKGCEYDTSSDEASE